MQSTALHLEHYRKRLDTCFSQTKITKIYEYETFYVHIFDCLKNHAYLCQTNKHTDLSQMLSEFKKRKLTAFFKTFDADGNGYIEKSDIEAIVSNLTAIRQEKIGSPTHQFLHTKYMADWQGLLQATDTNGDGKISLEEWFIFHDLQLQAAVPYWRAGEKTSVQFLFELIDMDGNGEIGKDEYALFLKAYHVPTEAGKVFPKLDLNGDGHISLSEFVLLCEQFYTSDDENAPGNWLFGEF